MMMRKYKIIFTINIILATFFLLSCEKDKEPSWPVGSDNPNGPVVNVSNTDKEQYYKGDVVIFTCDVEDEEGIIFLKVENKEWNLLDSLVFDTPVTSVNHEFKITVPRSASLGISVLNIAALNKNFIDNTNTAAVNIVKNPNVLSHMFAIGDMTFSASLGKGWDNMYADRLTEDDNGNLSVMVYNTVENGEFICLESRNKDAEFYGVDPDDANKLKLGSSTKITIPELGYHLIEVDPDPKSLAFTVIKQSITNYEYTDCYFLADGFEEVPTWDKNKVLLLTPNSNNPNEHNAVVTRNSNSTARNKFLGVQGSWYPIYRWVDDYNVSEFGDNSFNITMEDGAGDSSFAGDEGQVYRVKLDYIISKAIILPYEADPNATPATITLTSPEQPLSIVRGATVNVTGTITDQKGIQYVEVSCADWGLSIKEDGISNPQDFSINLKSPFDAPVGTSEIIVKVVNEDYLVTTETLQVNVESGSQFDQMYVTGDVTLAAIIGSGDNIMYAEKMGVSSAGFEVVVYNSKANGEFRFVTSRIAGEEEYYGIGANGAIEKDGPTFVIADIGYYKVTLAGSIYEIVEATDDDLVPSPTYLSDNMKVVGRGVRHDDPEFTEWNMDHAPQIPRVGSTDVFMSNSFVLGADANWVQLINQENGVDDWRTATYFAWFADWQLLNPGDTDFKISIKDDTINKSVITSSDASDTECSLAVDFRLMKCVIIPN